MLKIIAEVKWIPVDNGKRDGSGFIPYAGSATSLALLTVVALVSFDGVGKAVSVAGTYLILTSLEGQVLQPVLVGRRVDFNQPADRPARAVDWRLALGCGGRCAGDSDLVSAKVAAQEFSRAERDAKAEERVETVRTSASEWLKRNASRYRRGRLMDP